MGRYIASTSKSECLLCGDGQYIDEEGATECIACESGKNPNYHRSACLTCTAGTAVAVDSSAECVECTAGFYTPAAGYSECLPCEAGSFSDANLTARCTSCYVGTYSEAGQTECAECEPGTFSDMGASECSACDAGYFATDYGSSECSVCDRGAFASTPGSSECTLCPSGQYVLEYGATGCTKCEKGKISTSSGALSCSYCKDGYYQDSTGETECLQCGSNEKSNSGRSACVATTTTTTILTVNCEGHFSNWTDCSATCGEDVVTQRTWIVDQEAEVGGFSCLFDDGEVFTLPCKGLPTCETTTPSATTKYAMLRVPQDDGEVVYMSAADYEEEAGSCPFDSKSAVIDGEGNKTVVGGGCQNYLFDVDDGVVIGGIRNKAANDWLVLIGGSYSQSLSNYASSAGGYGNKALGRFSVVAGGSSNSVTKYHSSALGSHATSTVERTLTFGFDGEDCPGSSAKSVSFCADLVTVNDVSVLKLVDDYVSVANSRVRRLRSRSGVEIEQGILELTDKVTRQQQKIDELATIHSSNLVLRERVQALSASLDD